MALLTGQVGVAAAAEAAAAEEFPRGQRYKVPTFNGSPIGGMGDEEDRVFCVQFSCDEGGLKGIQIEGDSITFGDGQLSLSASGKPETLEGFVARILSGNAVMLRSLARSVGGRKEDVASLQSHRSDRTLIEGGILKPSVTTVVDVTYGLGVKADTLNLTPHPLAVVCPQDPFVFIEQGSEKKALKRSPPKKDTFFASFYPGDLCVQDGVVFMPYSEGGKGTWLKAIILQTHPDFPKHPFTAVMGNLGFFPPSTKGDAGGLYFSGAGKITIVVGPPDAAWEYVDLSKPMIIKGLAEGKVSMSLGKGSEDNYYRLSVPKLPSLESEKPGEGKSEPDGDTLRRKPGEATSSVPLQDSCATGTEVKK